MARARNHPNGLVRNRVQTYRERFLTREQYAELQRKRQARWDRGQATDEETVDSNEDENEEEKDDDAEEPEEPAPQEEVPLDHQAREDAIAMFVRTLLFSRGAATALYDDQAVQSLDTLREINDDMIREMARAIRKPGDGIQGYSISELSVSRLKLLAFWARHMWRTCRSIDDWADITWEVVSIPKNQKTLEDSLQDRKIPETPAMTLDMQSAAKAFLDMVVLLGKMRGISGIPLAYVVQYNLKM